MTCQGWWQQPHRLTLDLSHREPSITRGDHKAKGVWPRGASASKHNQGIKATQTWNTTKTPRPGPGSM